MGVFVTSDNTSIKHKFGHKQNIPIYLQFVPGLVLDVVLNEQAPAYGGPGDINCIIARKHYGEQTSEKAMQRTKYYPLLRGQVDIPIKGDPVLLCEFGGVDYYLGPLNTINSPNFSPDTLNFGDRQVSQMGGDRINDSDGKIRTNRPVNYLVAKINRLQKTYIPKLDDPTQIAKGEDGSYGKIDTHGDMLFEGRYGNSIRIGSRGAHPLIRISNGRNPGQGWELHSDGSIIDMITAGSIKDHIGPFILASDRVEKNPRLVAGGNDSEETNKFNYDFGTNIEDDTALFANQIFMNSGKITLNARNNNITLSSFINMDFGAGNNLTINTKNYTSIESSNIYLGKQARQKIEDGEEAEPLVLGVQLNDILLEIVEALETLKVTGCISGLSGPIDPPTTNKISRLKDKLASPKFWSEYHFIEDNGQKATGEESENSDEDDEGTETT